MNRRDFLRALGIGAAAAAIEGTSGAIARAAEGAVPCRIKTVLAGQHHDRLLSPPERRVWQVPRNAPVGSRIRSVRALEQHAGYLVTDADYVQRIVPYEEGHSLRMRDLTGRPRLFDTVPYEEYSTLLRVPVDRRWLEEQRAIVDMRKGVWKCVGSSDLTFNPPGPVWELRS